METPRLIKGGVAADDRGFVRFVNDFNFENVKRFYQVENHRAGFIRAWHGHLYESKYVYVPRGAALVGAVPLGYFQTVDFDGVGTIPGDILTKINRIVLTDKNPQIWYIPKGYANGFKTLEPNTIVQFFSTATIEEALKDDIRYPWDYPNIWEEEYR